MKTWYFKLAADNIIIDAIDYSFEGYTAVELVETSLPAGINGGWWKLENSIPVEYPELKPVSEDEKQAQLKTRLSASEEAILGLMDMLAI